MIYDGMDLSWQRNGIGAALPRAEAVKLFHIRDNLEAIFAWAIAFNCRNKKLLFSRINS